MKAALVMTDGKAGHENQSRAFARALGCEAEVVEVRFRSRFHKALSYVLDRFGVLTDSLYDRKLPPPGDFAVVIGTGSGTFYAAKVAARRLGVGCGVVLYPRGYRISTFDCVLAPSFDRPAAAPNVIEIPANLVANDDAFYAKGVEEFREHYRAQTGHDVPEGKLASAVIVGGPNRCSTMTPEWMRSELERIFAANVDRELWVTTSRRTPPAVEEVVDGFPWSYRLVYSRDRFNPIPAFVRLAARLYVTAESTGMLSEACTFGTAEVEALDNLVPGRHKFRRFVDGLRAAGHVGGSLKVDLSSQFAAARRALLQ